MRSWIRSPMLVIVIELQVHVGRTPFVGVGVIVVLIVFGSAVAVVSPIEGYGIERDGSGLRRRRNSRCMRMKRQDLNSRRTMKRRIGRRMSVLLMRRRKRSLSVRDVDVGQIEFAWSEIVCGRIIAVRRNGSGIRAGIEIDSTSTRHGIERRK